MLDGQFIEDRAVSAPPCLPHPGTTVTFPQNRARAAFKMKSPMTLYSQEKKKTTTLFQLRIRPSLISTMAKDHPLYRLGGWVTKSNVLSPKVSVILTITTQQFSLKNSCLWIENLLRSHDGLFNNLFNIIFLLLPYDIYPSWVLS